ncbi:polysaccharide pyruvyl transferase CsaB [Marinisporobacter balticus]|uniref:Polysaccharide pyruvyl transferase CsaB n=1 Tax=Marinisporobacter balticus TaxID=2018667 RepID=A0A4R2KQE1_9FIRM|nr:polysaccharide pyruvyl transferase CsaB [Marinisporobacter balticus]TCO73146.1 polysaccharide pyruvyl transferase CsaB [Marinisporobacter balticus]
MGKIVISGYYGFNNVGDESILTAIVNNLKDSIKDIEITVLSVNPESTSQKHKINAIDRKNIFQIYKAIKNCEVFISGGGSLLQDVTSGRSITYYLVIIFMAIILRKKVLIYSQGIGPINKWFNKYMVQWVLNKVDCISVRDEKSKELLKKIGVYTPDIYVTADPVISLKQGNKKTGREILTKEGMDHQSEKPLIGFAIRGWRDNDEFLSNICKTADKLIEHSNVDVVFIPFHFGEDIKILEEIAHKMEQKAFFIKNKYDIEEMLGIVGNLDLLVGVRLHSLIFAAIMNVPIIAISYDPKIDSFMKSLQLKTLCSTEGLNYVDLILEIELIQKKHEAYKNILTQRVKKLQEKARINEKLVIELLKKGRHQREE